MVRFATVAIIYGFGMLLLALPLRYIALRHGREDSWRKAIITATVIAITLAVVDATSRRAVAQCWAAGNPTCVDSGSAGIQLLFAGGFVAWSWIIAYLIYND